MNISCTNPREKLENLHLTFSGHPYVSESSDVVGGLTI